MSDNVALTFWNYNRFADYKPEMLKDWVDCGMTDPVSPTFSYARDDHAKFAAMLDDADKLGVRIILQINEMFLDNALDPSYPDVVARIVKEFGSHPAAGGYYVGEEPSHGMSENYFRGVKIIREADQKARIYTNMGSTERTNRSLLSFTGETLEEWCGKLVKESGADIIGFGTYNHMIYDNPCLDDIFYNVRIFTELGKKFGADVWATMLSSAHYSFRVPTEDDFRWQLNACVACGCRAVVWFRLYDKLIAADYHGSPIDEFGEKTTRYYDLARVQKKFNYHYGKLFMKLNHISTEGVGTGYGGYFYYIPGSNELIDRAASRAALLSMFKGDDGFDYAVVFNVLQRESTSITLTYSEKVEKVETVYKNGEDLRGDFERNGRPGPITGSEIWLAPGQMEVLKITRV